MAFLTLLTALFTACGHNEIGSRFKSDNNKSAFLFYCESETSSKPIQNMVAVLLDITNSKSCSEGEMRLHNLSRLELPYVYSRIGLPMVDLAPISDLTGLVHLSIQGGYISDVSALKNLINLRYLSLNNNKISDLGPISKLFKLQWLDLGRNQIKNIEAVQRLQDLINLNISYNRVNNLDPLARLANLENLWADNNLISDLTPLGKVIKLKTIYLARNSVSDISTISQLQNLTNVSFSNNPLGSTIHKTAANCPQGRGIHPLINKFCSKK